MRSNEADVREGIDAEEVWVARARVRVVGYEGLGKEREFGVEGLS